MLEQGPLPYILGVIAITILGFLARTFFAGLRENIVKAVVDSALKKILGELTQGIAELKADMGHVKAAQQTSAGTGLLYLQELHDFRNRMEEHLKTDEEFQKTEHDWRTVVAEFIDWSTNFLKTHMHVGAIATEQSPLTPART